MILSLSKIISFLVTFVNIALYYLSAGSWYAFTSLSSIFTKIPVIGFLFVFPLELVNIVLGKLILYIWYIFDYFVLFLREFIVPLITIILKTLKKPLLYIWNFLVSIFHFFKPKCDYTRNFCPYFDKNLSYTIAGMEITQLKQENKKYEKELRDYYQQEIKKFFAKNDTDIFLVKLDKLYEQCKTYQNEGDIDAYNRLLNKLQKAELNIAKNYTISLNQHRLILVRESKFNDFSTPQKLFLYANQRSLINNKVLI